MKEKTIFCCSSEIQYVSFGYGWVWVCPYCRKVIKSLKAEIQDHIEDSGKLQAPRESIKNDRAHISESSK